MRVRAAGTGSIGKIREQNDDHYCLGQCVEQSALTVLQIDTHSRMYTDYGVLAAVADGMGGYSGGGFASGMVLDTLVAQYYGEKRTGCSPEQLVEQVDRYIRVATDVLRGRLEREPNLSHAGTTLAGVALTPPDVVVLFHVGDSRVHRCCSGYCRQLTVDHTPIGADLLAGRVGREQLEAAPDAGRLTRSIGLVGDTRPDISGEGQSAPGDRFVITTDGCSGAAGGVPTEQLAGLLSPKPSADDAVKCLLAAALEADGSDNATAVVIDLVKEEPDGR